MVEGRAFWGVPGLLSAYLHMGPLELNLNWSPANRRAHVDKQPFTHAFPPNDTVPKKTHNDGEKIHFASCHGHTCQTCLVPSRLIQDADILTEWTGCELSLDFCLPGLKENDGGARDTQSC